jgi:hypothetical protein
MGFGHAKLSKTENMLYGVKVMMVGGSSSGSIYSIDFGIQHQLSEKLLLEMTWAAYINAFNSSGPGLLGNVTSFYMTYIL